jgi:hypothetical protein
MSEPEQPAVEPTAVTPPAETPTAVPADYTAVTENGRTYYVATQTGFKTPHLRYMLNHVARLNNQRPASGKRQRAKENS